MNQTETRPEGYRRLIEITRDLASTLNLDILLEQSADFLLSPANICRPVLEWR